MLDAVFIKGKAPFPFQALHHRKFFSTLFAVSFFALLLSSCAEGNLPDTDNVASSPTTAPVKIRVHRTLRGGM